MKIILLLGAIYNFFGAVPILLRSIRSLARPPKESDGYLYMDLFVAGTAAVFGSFYLYLFFHPRFIVPFLIFGAALKTWALLIALYLYIKRRISRQVMLQVGVGNGVIAGLFWVLIISTLT